MPTLVVQKLDAAADGSYVAFMDLLDTLEQVQRANAEGGPGVIQQAVYMRTARDILRPMLRLEDDDGTLRPHDQAEIDAAMRSLSLARFVELFEGCLSLPGATVDDAVPKASAAGSGRRSTATSTTKTLSRRNGSKSGH